MKSKSINPAYRQAGAKITKNCKVRKVETRFSSFLLPLGIPIAIGMGLYAFAVKIFSFQMTMKSSKKSCHL
jgi:hypothetical protein